MRIRRATGTSASPLLGKKQISDERKRNAITSVSIGGGR